MFKTTIVALSQDWYEFLNIHIVKGNPLWRFALVLLIVIVAMVLGRIVQYLFRNYAISMESKKGATPLSLICGAISKPIYVGIFAAGVFLARIPLLFDNIEGIPTRIDDAWIKIAKSVVAIAFAYGLYRLVDVVEYYLNRVVSKTQTKLDDMLVPIVRKALRITIAIVAALIISESILGTSIKSILLSAGVGGIAVALAAKDTIANFFGSITIFADRPFQIDEMIKIEGYSGPVEAVGLRSTRIRTLQGHLVTVPNSVVANSIVENIGRRPYIRRTSNITITYDSGHDKTQRAVQIIKEVLGDVPEINTDSERPPRVYFSDFNDWSLNIYMTYWLVPPDFWLCQEVNERVNFEIQKRFETEKIEFAFPTQTLYVKKD
ncbi:MAG: mechanosensitive ion channel family protein [Planctomycetota bacterium]|jgi:MscS family membrane protein